MWGYKTDIRKENEAGDDTGSYQGLIMILRAVS